MKNWFNFLKPLMTKTIVNEDPVPEKTLGSYGRLEIPDLSISVPLYSVGNKSAQKIVDDPDSAAIFGLGKQMVIADHVHQSNFGNLIRVQPGRTKAYVLTVDGQQAIYICMLSQLGHIQLSETGNRLYDWEGIPAKEKNPDGLAIYTCLGSASNGVQNVTLTYWKKSK